MTKITVSKWILDNQGGDECLVPDCARTADGYIRITVSQVRWLASRWILYMTTGLCPKEKEAAHTCGNRACINAKHLYWASPGENETDKLKHGTSHVQKLTIGQVLAIREDNRPQRTVAAEYGICQQQVSNIKTRKKWKHI